MSKQTTNIETEWHNAHACTLTYSDGRTVDLEQLRRPALVRVRVRDNDNTPSGEMDRRGVTVHELVERYGGEAYPVQWFAVGDGVTICGYSDRQAYTVVAVSPSGKTATIQRDNAELLNGHDSGEPDALTFTPGGFVGHTDGVQRYAYTRDTDGATLKIRLGKMKKWSSSHGSVVAGRSEFYDYNF